nr:MAG TPA: hypothetical protein [Caudoviricetes sp.]
MSGKRFSLEHLNYIIFRTSWQGAFFLYAKLERRMVYGT